jgi:hypothetical protein
LQLYHLVTVPDGSVYQLPFDALSDAVGGLGVGLDIAGQKLAEFCIEFLGRAGIGERKASRR